MRNSCSSLKRLVKFLSLRGNGENFVLVQYHNYMLLLICKCNGVILILLHLMRVFVSETLFLYSSCIRINKRNHTLKIVFVQTHEKALLFLLWFAFFPTTVGDGLCKRMPKKKFSLGNVSHNMGMTRKDEYRGVRSECLIYAVCPSRGLET